VIFSHKALLANALQLRAWLPGLRPGRETLVSAVPLAHSYGLAAGLHLSLLVAARLVLAPGASPAALLRVLRRERPLLFVGVPGHYQALNARAQEGPAPAGRRGVVQLGLSGAGPLPVEAREAFERLARARVLEGYSLAEAGLLTLAQPTSETRTGTVGLPLPGTQARVADLETGLPAPAGSVGELWVRGPQLMTAYATAPAGRAPALPVALEADGWARTGDLARMDDDGYFQVLGRRRDLWRAPDGTLVIARDVEEVIYELPEVSEVAVIAGPKAPSPPLAVGTGGQAGGLAAFVALHPGEVLSTETLLAFCRRRLPASHVPVAVTCVPRLPRNFMGQVERGLLRYAAPDGV
jgi:long-chain acyl-CoA synthetase